ncbi:VOC family protein [Streptomyces sp. H27-D2]|uniref:VOC family protein n=1 Tax=Streptomyces sp. H27-D2 TaxID=3046304 RepID=UPI002DB5E621|nr:VOC family protein [Streptomyces sp. H27-D2]MEC4015824.1 VOC family protein [Streptomyces sp. H27-D2]
MTEAATRRTPGTPCWVSLMVHGLSATQDFYHALFGWEFQPGPEHLGPYVRALLDGREVAGIGELAPDRHLSVAWTTYLATDDADASAERIRSCGGTVGVGPLDADNAGRMALASDPQGALFGVWQACGHGGTKVFGEPGSPVWNELVARETSMVGKFYEAVFGYESETVVSADSDHLTLRLDGRPVAAIHGVGRALPRDRGAHWMTYFEVADTDAAARRVVELGGQVLRAPRDEATGRQAVVADPEGAVFSVVRSSPRPD